MPTLDFKGKPFVYSHHLSVPFRGLEIDKKRSMPGKGGPSLDDNLIIHGDNLEALKALLPKYAGKVDIIYIDPPYNTGNEGWVYNDNVNSPLMKNWLGDIVDSDDLEKHDKWLSMMWPRVTLLRELLSETGYIAISCDNNEYHNLVGMMNEVFGQSNFINNITIRANPRGRQSDKKAATVHDYLLVYAKDHSECLFTGLPPSDDYELDFKHIDADGRKWRELGLRQRGAASNREDREDMFFPIYVDTVTGEVSLKQTSKFDHKVLPLKSNGVEGRWSWGKAKVKKDSTLIYGRTVKGKNGPRVGIFYRDYFDKGGVGRWQRVKTIWDDKLVNTERGGKLLKDIFNTKKVFDYPKPIELIERVIQIHSKKNCLILDSFAGSGTTGHAVMRLNQDDAGTRKFILIETESYADNITAERIRRIIKGVPKAKNEFLKKGIRSSFTYCDLGDPIDIDAFFNGDENMPSYQQIASYIAYTATGEALTKSPKVPRKDWFIGEINGTRLHLIYKDDADFMKSGAAALTEDLAKEIAKSNTSGKTAYVFGAVKYMSQKELSTHDYQIQFCQLPYSIYRIMGDAPGTE